MADGAVQVGAEVLGALGLQDGQEALVWMDDAH
jgi:hypothetical protein